MPHATLKLQPGVDQNRTLALNEAAISDTQLVRFVPDKQGLGLVQKLGGWTKFFPSAVTDIVRALWAWEDTNADTHLAVGCQSTSISGAGLSVISSGAQQVITPVTKTDNVSVQVSTIAGSPLVLITDAGSNLDNYDSVYIKTQISVGGLILFGVYACTYVSSNVYQITAIDAAGSPLPATTTVTNGGSVPVFTFTINTSDAKVTLNDHGYNVYDTFPIIVSVTGGGVTLSGNYIVSKVIDANNFLIGIGSVATSTATVSMNAGLAQYLYYLSPGPLPTGTGYGVGGYGSGGYGIGTAPPVTKPGNPIPATDWTLDNWGDYLISCPVGGEIFEWNPVLSPSVASIIQQAPPVNDGIFVAMPQRQIVAWGSTSNGVQDPLLVRWCDVEDFNSWIPTVTNQAGSYRIPKGSKIICGIQGPQQGLIWTDLAVWAMQYSGPPYVYQFNEIGTGCGLIARKAATSMNGIVYWMGQSQFFRLGANGVEPIQCPIWDVIFQDLDTSNLSKIRVAANSNFGEITWYYPTLSNGGEINAYVKYNVVLNQWDFGELSRTAWINQSVLGPPIGSQIVPGSAPARSYIYQHETSTDADGSPLNASFQTGYFVISDAEWKVFVDQVWPDMKWGYYGGSQNAVVNLTFYINDYPGQTPREYGPYTMTKATTFLTPRFRGRLMSIKIESNDLGSFWRIGAMRYRFEQDGKF